MDFLFLAPPEYYFLKPVLVKTILYIHQYFKTPGEGGAIRSYHIAGALTARGMRVEMITAHNGPVYEKKVVDGIHVHYLPVPYSNAFSFRRRVYAFLKFAYLAAKLAAQLPAADLCYATSTPLTVGLVALRLKKIRQIPYIFEVRDLWPEAPIQLKIIKSPIMKGLLRKLEKTIYRQARAIIALSPAIETEIRKTVPDHEIHTIPNMADTEFFSNCNKNRKLGDPFVISYFGAFGKANHLEYLLDIAAECQKASLPVQFVLAGEGAEKKMLEEKAATMKNVRFLPFQNREGIRSLMKETDACFVSFLNNPILETNSPNKFFDALAAGKPCIVNTRGWLADLVKEWQCGFYADPDKPQAFPELIKPYIHDEKLLKSHGENALRLAEAGFSKTSLTEAVCDIVSNVIKEGQ